MSDPYHQFLNEVSGNIAALGDDRALHQKTRDWLLHSAIHKYSYNFSWLGRPIIQYPQDIVAFQELVWQVKPDLIIETGIAHGGSLILSASLLAMIDLCEATESGELLDPRKPKRTVLGIDIDIRPHNRAFIEAHPMSARIDMLEGSSVDEGILSQVRAAAGGKGKVLVSLDSNHTHEHVLAELEAYAPLVTRDSYCCVFDTVIEDLPPELIHDRPWKKGDNPKTAVWAFLEQHPEFEIDKSIEDKLQITVAPDGFLRRTAD